MVNGIPHCPENIDPKDSLPVVYNAAITYYPLTINYISINHKV